MVVWSLHTALGKKRAGGGPALVEQTEPSVLTLRR